MIWNDECRLSPALVRLWEKWEGFAADPAELLRVGIAPKPGNRRGLLALLAKHNAPELDELYTRCRARHGEAIDPEIKQFWLHRMQAIEHAIQHRGKILGREKVRNRRRRKQAARDREAKAIAADRNKPAIRLSSDSYPLGGGARIVRGGAPSLGKRR